MRDDVELKLSEEDQKVRAQVAQVCVAWDLREACACACSMLVRGWVLLTHRKASIHLPFLTVFVQDSPPEQHGFLGTHGFSRMHLLLWYTLFNDLCFVPFAHALFRGVFRDFMLMVLSTQEALKTRANKSTELPHLPGYRIDLGSSRPNIFSRGPRDRELLIISQDIERREGGREV